MFLTLRVFLNLDFAVDSELGEDINDGGILDNSTDNDHELGKHTATAGSSEEMTQNILKEKSNVVVVEGDEPYVGQEFDTEEAAHAFYSAYSMRVGFVIRMNYLSRSKLDGTIIGRTLVCNKEGYRKSYRCDKQSLKPRTPTRVGCKAMLSIRKLNTGKWIVSKFVKEHTHSLTARHNQTGLIIHQIPVSYHYCFADVAEFVLRVPFCLALYTVLVLPIHLTVDIHIDY